MMPARLLLVVCGFKYLYYALISRQYSLRDGHVSRLQNFSILYFFIFYFYSYKVLYLTDMTVILNKNKAARRAILIWSL